jgi:hypothetical protein
MPSAPARNRRVDRYLEGAEAGPGRPVEQRVHQLAIANHVELEPELAVSGGRELLDRGGAGGGQPIGHAAASGSSRHRDFALGMDHAGEPGRGQAERDR